MAASFSSTKVTLKLLIDTKNKKVLFAEASKPVADFLFNILCLPIGTIVKLIGYDTMMGSLGNLYHSAQNLNQDYVQSGQTKDVVLNQKPELISSLLPTTGVSAFVFLNKLDQDDVEGDEDYQDAEEDEEDEDEDVDEDQVDDATIYEEEEEEKEKEEEDGDGVKSPGGTLFYTCPTDKCSHEVTRDNTTPCSQCMQLMNRKMRYVTMSVAKERTISIEKGLVKDIETNFMVTDDLLIQPMPTLSNIALLMNSFNITDIGTLQEKVVELGVHEGIKLLKASLQSKMVLTSVFIKNEY